MSLAARDVTKRFGGLTALSRVSLDVMPGEVHGLIGPNGSGKTTLLNLLSGYYRPDEGAIQMAQQKLSSATVQQRANLGIARTFQKPRLLPTLSVLDNAMIGGWRDARAGFLATAFMLPRASFDERELRNRAEELLHGVGLSHAITERGRLDLSVNARAGREDLKSVGGALRFSLTL